MPNILSELINEAEENIEVLKFKEGYDRGDPCASLFNGIILQALIDISIRSMQKITKNFKFNLVN